MVKVWLIDNDDFKPVDVKILSPDQVYLIPDADKKKIFIWAGKDCPKIRLYKAGTLATKFKSVGKFYGYEIEKMDEAIEPAKFLTETGEETTPASPTPAIGRQSAGEPNDSGQCAPAMTFNEAKEYPSPATSGNTLEQIIAELAGIKEMLNKIWQKVKTL
jgi:hypothetical protein